MRLIAGKALIERAIERTRLEAENPWVVWGMPGKGEQERYNRGRVYRRYRVAAAAEQNLQILEMLYRDA